MIWRWSFWTYTPSNQLVFKLVKALFFEFSNKVQLFIRLPNQEVFFSTSPHPSCIHHKYLPLYGLLWESWAFQKYISYPPTLLKNTFPFPPPHQNKQSERRKGTRGDILPQISLCIFIPTHQLLKSVRPVLTPGYPPPQRIKLEGCQSHFTNRAFLTVLGFPSYSPLEFTSFSITS